VACNESPAVESRLTAANFERSSNVPELVAVKIPCSVIAIVPPESGVSVAIVV
jgi:hypothetical protein